VLSKNLENFSVPLENHLNISLLSISRDLVSLTPTSKESLTLMKSKVSSELPNPQVHSAPDKTEILSETPKPWRDWSQVSLLAEPKREPLFPRELRNSKVSRLREKERRDGEISTKPKEKPEMLREEPANNGLPDSTNPNLRVLVPTVPKLRILEKLE